MLLASGGILWVIAVNHSEDTSDTNAGTSAHISTLARIECSQAAKGEHRYYAKLPSRRHLQSSYHPDGEAEDRYVQNDIGELESEYDG